MMDPITAALVVSAAGAAASEPVKLMIGDTYKGLKGLIGKAFGTSNAVIEAVDRLEAKPESEARKQEVAEAVAETGATENAEVVKAAEALLAKLKEAPAGEQHIQSAIGSYIAQADHGSTATVTVNRRD